MQKNWIGKSHGSLINFKLKDSKEIISIFTTRPDTLWGVTFMVYAPEHPRVLELVKGTKYEEKARKFVEKTINEDKYTRTAEDKEKEGMFIGRYAVNPVNNDVVPIYIANFVLAEYGTGVVMAVPAHDQRDFEFAKKYKIPVKVVIQPREHALDEEKMVRAYLNNGVIVNSDERFNGLDNFESIKEIINYLEEMRYGKNAVQYKLRDWLISRQRYWGTPIPIIYCDNCGVVPVDEKELPVLLPENVKFTGKGNPLSMNEKFVNVKCHKCKGKARRETDTMGTFFDSSWYFLRYCDPRNSKQIFDKKKVSYWMPVNQYIGGIEHAAGHLIYSRFFTKFMRDIKLLNFDEPFMKLFNQGIVHKNGMRMSKSHGNTVTAEEISKKYGIDAARLFMMFVSSPDKDMEWDEHGIEGAFRMANKLMRLFDNAGNRKENAKLIEHKLNKTLKLVEQSYENFEFNKGIIAFFELVNYLSDKKGVSKGILEKMVLMVAPVMPHVAEEMWHKLGNKTLVAQEKWPKYDEKKINKKFDEQEKAVEKTIEDISNIVNIIKQKKDKDVNKVYLYVIPSEINSYDSEMLSKRVGKEVKIFTVNDKKKYDPENKSQKAKPGKPGIYAG